MANLLFWTGVPFMTWSSQGSNNVGFEGGPDWMNDSIVWAQLSLGLIQYMEFDPLNSMVIQKSYFSRGPLVSTVYGMRVPTEEVQWVDGLPFISEEAPDRVTKEYP
jgi:hypothetical protein